MHINISKARRIVPDFSVVPSDRTRNNSVLGSASQEQGRRRGRVSEWLCGSE